MYTVQYRSKMAYLAGASNELQEQCFLLRREGLQHCPEVCDLRVRGLVALVVSVGPQVIQVDVREA